MALIQEGTEKLASVAIVQTGVGVLSGARGRNENGHRIEGNAFPFRKNFKFPGDGSYGVSASATVEQDDTSLLQRERVRYPISLLFLRAINESLSDAPRGKGIG